MKPDSLSATRRRLRDSFREQTATAILAAAEEAFAEEGLQGARMESIAARAGVAVGTVYNHFDDRDALLRELVRSRRGALLAKLDAAIAAAEHVTTHEALRGFFRALFSHWATHARFLSVLFQSEPPSVPGAAGTMRHEILARAETLLRRGISAGDLRASCTKLHAAGLVGLAWGVIVAALEEGRLDRIEDQVSCVVDLFWQGARS